MNVGNGTFQVDLSFDDDSAFDANFSNGTETFETDMGEVTQVVTGDHRKLTYRDAADQHPIMAITNLAPELETRPSTAMSNQDIQNILGG